MSKRTRRVKMSIFWQTILYRLEWYKAEEGDDDEHTEGYYLAKRRWLWLLALPMVMPFIILAKGLSGVGQYILSVFQVRAHWVNSKKRKLNRYDRRYLRYTLMH